MSASERECAGSWRERMVGSAPKLPFGPPVALFDVDPDLAVGVPAGELETAGERALARTLDVAPPTWDAAAIAAAADDGWPGLLVIEGLLLRCVTVGQRSACELFGA